VYQWSIRESEAYIIGWFVESDFFLAVRILHVVL
jgi:hypothetical protein